MISVTTRDTDEVEYPLSTMGLQSGLTRTRARIRVFSVITMGLIGE